MRISSTLLKQMVDHAFAEAPYECCGLVAAKDGEAVKVYPLTNAADDFEAPAYYETDPQEQIDTFEKIRAEGWELGAIFHSHPNIEPYPSAIDTGRAGYDCLYVIIGLKGRRGSYEAEVRTFTIDQYKEITEVTLEISDPTEMILRPVLVSPTYAHLS